MEDIKNMTFTRLIEYFQDSVISYIELGTMEKEEFESIKKEILDRYSKACHKTG